MTSVNLSFCIHGRIISMALQSLLGFGRFFRFLILYTVGRIPWMGISPSQGIYLQTEQHKHRINTDIHALSGIRTHDPSVRAGEDISCRRQRGHCDRHTEKCHIRKLYTMNTKLVYHFKGEMRIQTI
jgi:hypothetical protein